MLLAVAGAYFFGFGLYGIVASLFILTIPLGVPMMAIGTYLWPPHLREDERTPLHIPRADEP